MEIQVMSIKSRPLLSFIAAAAFCATAATSASADTYALGTLGNSFSYTGLFPHATSSQTFSDLFTFTVPDSYTADLSAFTLNLSPFGVLLDIDNLQFTLDGVGGEISGVGAGIMKSFTALASGDYQFEVTGKATGWFGGAYIGHMEGSLSPVPEPATYAMLIAGLGLVGMMARRRSSSL
jgi:hypothetical protein